MADGHVATTLELLPKARPMTPDPDRYGLLVVILVLVLAAVGAGWLLGSLVSLAMGWL